MRDEKLEIIINEAAIKHLDEFIQMHMQLMEDEQFDRKVSHDELKNKWKVFFNDKKFKITLFQIEEEIIGYSLVQVDLNPNYLRHFFIKEEYRRNGFGTQCFKLLVLNLGVNQLDLDAMSWNKRGLKFWQSLGFTERCKMMTFSSDGKRN